MNKSAKQSPARKSAYVTLLLGVAAFAVGVFASPHLFRSAGPGGTIAPLELTSWRDRPGDVAMRMTPDGALLLGLLGLDETPPYDDPTWAPDPAKIPRPDAPLYRFTRVGSGQGTIVPADMSLWTTASGGVNYLWEPIARKADGEWKVDNGSQRLLFNGSPVRTAGRSVFLRAITPDGSSVAVVSAAGSRRTHPSLLAAGGAPPDYDGPFYVELFDKKDGKSIGHPLRLNLLDRTTDISGNWSPGGGEFVCIDGTYQHIWFLSFSAFCAAYP